MAISYGSIAQHNVIIGKMTLIVKIHRRRPCKAEMGGAAEWIHVVDGR